MPRSLRAAAAALLALLVLVPAAHAEQRFPRGFLWGTATAGFQVEAGGRPANADRASDWWAWTTDPGLIAEGVVSGDRVDRGPGQWRVWPRDLDLAAGALGNNAIRLGIEWSRIFPRSTAGVRVGAGRPGPATLRRLDRLADPRAVRHYRSVLRGARARGLRVMLTLNHYTLPRWAHDPVGVRRAFAGRGPDDPLPADLPPAGWLDRSLVTQFRTFAAYAAHRFGDLVDLWATVNEPLVQVSQGYTSIPGVTGSKPPGVLSYAAAIAAVQHLALANAAAYDAIHAARARARVGFVHNLLDWRPADPASADDRRAAGNADRIYNRLFLDAAMRGIYDRDADGVVDPGEREPRLAGKADFIGVNHYSPARARALPAPVSARVPLFDFVPQIAYRGNGNPQGPPCPATCTDFGWEVDPEGMRNVLRLAGEYDRPVYVTENGLDDADDAQRAAYLTGYLRAVHRAIADGVDVRGYFHWTLVDNFEWSEGFAPRFGLFAFDPVTLERRARPSARLYARIARRNAVP